MLRFRRITVLFAAMVFGMAAAQSQTYLGQVRAVGNGTASSWVTVDRAGTPQAIGITLSEGVLTGLPPTHTEYRLALPPQARTPFHHLTVDWQPHGHIPEGVYNIPHFDLHFYLISDEERERITVTGEDLARVERMPDARFVPRGYVATPGGEPRMGAHWIDPASAEFHGHPFTATFIYGFYNGRMVFLEPMLSAAFLQARPTVHQVLSLPQVYPAAGYYPTTFDLRFDSVTRLYHVTLGGMTQR